MTKKKSSEILAHENLTNFSEKVKLGKFSTESEKYFRNREGNPKQGGNASLPHWGMDAPVPIYNVMLSEEETLASMAIILNTNHHVNP